MSAALGSRMYSASRYLAPLARRTIAGHAIRSFQTVTPTHLWAVRFAPSASRSSSVVGRSFQQHRFASSLAVGDVYDVVVPTMGDSITEGTIVTWVKQPGEYVAPDEVYCVVETDKVTVDINATQGGGILKEILAEEGDNVEVGAVFAKFEYTEPPAGGAPVAKDDSPPTPPAPPAAPAASTPPAPPASAPTPPASAPPAMKPSPAPSAPAAAAASSEGDRTEKRVKMTRMRKRIAERLTESQETAVMLTTFNEVDMSKLMALRKKYKDQFEKVHGVKLGFMSAFVRAATVALQEVPAVNAIIDGDHIVFRDYVDISVAVSSPRGLVVPVLRDTQKMSFADVEREIGILGAKARNDTITLEEMTGGTFSVTNGGVFGSLMSTPIINMPQSAILGMHGIKERPVVVDGEIVARPMMYIALTYDHRLIDGRESVTFLKSIKEKVEDPERFLLGL